MIEAKAYSQVSYIISLMSENLKRKIPQDFVDMIERKKDKEFKIQEKNIKEMILLGDTEKILSVIYTDYIASNVGKNGQTREELNQKITREDSQKV